MSTMRIHLVDDEESVRKGIAFGLRQQFEVLTFARAETALKAIRQQPPDLVILDIGLPGMGGVEALHAIKAIDAEIVVVMATAFEDVETVVACMKAGALDYIVKPIHLDTLKNTLGNAMGAIRLRREVRDLQTLYLRENLPGFIGESNAIQDVMEVVRRVAASPDTAVMISGASGTGKEVVARAIHCHSPNFKGPFVALNCAAIPGELLESELFGYEKGAFSGARTGGKKGLIEEAEGGTLFLDEIGDLIPEGQAKLLRFLEGGEYYRVGGTRRRHVRTRIVSATNRDLQAAVEKGAFRLDLYYRLAVIKIAIPSLNERADDILPFANHFLSIFSQKHHKSFRSIAPDLQCFLIEHRWRGNIRELRNLIERGVLMGNPPELTLQAVGSFAVSAVPAKAVGTPSPGEVFRPLPDDGIDLEALERHYIKEALRKCNGNDRQAARLLGMTYYAFRYRRKKYFPPSG
jgi:DNA-binding NtrC family response regulator